MAFREQRVNDVAAVNAKHFENISAAKQRQKQEFESRSGRNVKSFHIEEGDEGLKANMRKVGRKG